MREALRADDFARLVRVPVEDVERLAEVGLIDPDADGLFDDVDLVRYNVLSHYVDRGRTADDVVEEIRSGSYGALLADRLFRTGRAMSVDVVAERGGVDPERLRTMLVTLGLQKEVLNERDVDVAYSLRTILDAGLPWEAVLETARVLGDSLRRIAEAEIRTIHVHVHERLLAAGASEQEVSRQIFEIEERTAPLIEPMIRWIHEEHLLQAWIEDAFVHAMAATRTPTSLGSVETTIVFVDVAGFTELVETEGDAAAAAVLDHLDDAVRVLALEHDGKLVKQIGDGFMLVFRAPPSAVRFAVALQESTARRRTIPALRIGINHGTALHRAGDYIGSAVNVASRVTDAAMPGQILLTETVARVDHGASLEEVGVRILRGIDSAVPLWRVARTGNARDPVCGREVGADPAARLTRDGEELVFCSEDCLRTFVASGPSPAPAAVTQAPGGPRARE